MSLKNAAKQYYLKDNDGDFILSGYPWGTVLARNTFMSLPGTTLAIDHKDDFESIMETASAELVKFMETGELSARIHGIDLPDIPLWAVWAIQQYAKNISTAAAHEVYMELVEKIINYILENNHPNLQVDDNVMVSTIGTSTPVSWMNSMMWGKPVVPRTGYLVEFNALWYNALRFAATLSENDETRQEFHDKCMEQAEKMARMALMKLWHRNNGKIPTAIIEDYPDFHYRGVLIDISRNNQPLETLENIAFKLAQYRMNKLHFHFNDDEAWRLEIPSFPELTQLGSRRGYTLDEKEYLVQIFAGNGNPNETKGSSNGYITRQQFVDFLKKCHALGVDVIPEIESPGHARAAIKAMEARYQRTGDPIYRLIEDGDTSKYTSAQAFHDNVMNPALDGPINFMRTVIGEIISMYKDAGVELTAIHIGGDEVPDGAWNGSPSAQALIKEKNLDGEKGLHAYFVKQIANILAERGIPMNGWQEIAIGHSDEYNNEVAPLTGGVNSWTVFNPKAPIDKHVSVQALKAGYPVILSNVNHFYLDQSYNYHPDEPGLTWGGVVDEFASLNGYPAKMCPVPDELKEKIIGLSGQVFAETLRSPEQLESYLFPKMFGLAERAWNANETYSNAHFNKLIAEKELPTFGDDCNFHLRQPGIMNNKGTIKMNSPYEKAVIRYTLDGSEPTIDSPIYTKPIKTDATEIRARLYYLGKESVTTILYR